MTKESKSLEDVKAETEELIRKYAAPELTDEQRELLRKKQRETLLSVRDKRKREIREAARAVFGKDEELTEEKIKELEELIIKASRFNINFHCVNLLQGDPFFCKVSQRVSKQVTLRIPTAAIAYANGDFRLLYNPFFMASLDPEQVKFVLKHEFYHLVLGHLTSRRKDLARLWNIGTDLAINCLIQKGGGKPPERCLIPGVKPLPPPPGTRMTPEEKKANEKFALKIESLPTEKASEWYYEELKRFCKENNIDLEPQPCAACAAGVPFPQPGDEDGDEAPGKGAGDEEEGQKAGGKGDQPQDGEGDGDGDGKGDQPGDGDGHGHGHDHGEGSGDGQPQHTCGGGIVGISPLDDHDGWGDVPDEEREYAQARARKIIGDAVNDASQSNSWGTVPAHMQALLRERYSNQINWRALLRNFTGRARGTTRVPSMKVINRRYPYIHPGIKRGYTANLWIYVDQSGSVDDRSLELLFGELNQLTRKMDIRLFPFDHGVSDEDSFIWRRGQKVPARRVRCGGTSFQAVVDHLDKNSGMCDGALIMSDGECGQPTKAPCRFGYIIVPGRKLLFDPRPNEMHIQMKDNKAEVGGEW